MNKDIELYNILQISDLHFADKLGGAGNDALSAELPPLLRQFPWFDGLLGHHYRALTALQDFCTPVLQGGVKCLLVVSGDLTTNGAVPQFDFAYSYLSAEWANETSLGLGYLAWSDSSIAGNHDNWPGNNRIWGRPTPGLSRYLGSYPYVGPLIPLQNGMSLRFLFIDSDADVGPYSLKRLLAQGDFVSQLTKLRDMIPKIEEKEIRILVMHHSLMPRPAEEDGAVQNSRSKRILEIVSGCRRVLDRFLLECDVRVIMTGHMHIPRLSIIPVSNGIEEGVVFEARCGTTTQRDRYPDHIYKAIPATRRLPPNTLIRHQIVE